MPTCQKCGHDKPQDDFYKSSKTVCRSCFLQADRAKRAAKAAPAGWRITYAPGCGPVSYASNSTLYLGQELTRPAARPGAMNAFALPSRMGNALHYRDGRVERLP